jgi:hypothetical protein
MITRRRPAVVAGLILLTVAIAILAFVVITLLWGTEPFVFSNRMNISWR